MHRSNLARAAMLAAVISAAEVSAASAETWKVAGQLGGPTQGIAAGGGHVFAGAGMQLVVLDASDPAAIRQVGATTPFPCFLRSACLRRRSR